MSAPLAVDDVIQFVIGYRVASQELRAVLHYRVQTAGSGVSAEGQLETIAAFLTGATPTNWPLLTAMKAGTTTGTFWDFLQVQRVKPTRTIYARSEINDFGTIEDTPAPSICAVSIEKRSLKPGRKGIGRLQLGGLPSAEVSSVISDEWVSGFGNAIRDALPDSVAITTEGSMSLKPCLPAGGIDHDYDLWDALVKDTTRSMHRRTLGLGI